MSSSRILPPKFAAFTTFPHPCCTSVLDPPGVILDIVCEPVRQYLRERQDTVRSVMVGLTDEDSAEWQEAVRIE